MSDKPFKPNTEARKFWSLLGKQDNPNSEARKFWGMGMGKPPEKPKKSLPENRYRDRDFTGITRMGGVTYDLSIPHHRELYNAAVKKNQDAIPDSQKGDIRGGGGLKDDGKTS